MDPETELRRLEAALARWQECDEEEVDPEEYAEALRRVVELREALEGKP